jgi:hypothetical protein
MQAVCAAPQREGRGDAVCAGRRGQAGHNGRQGPPPSAPHLWRRRRGEGRRQDRRGWRRCRGSNTDGIGKVVVKISAVPFRVRQRCPFHPAHGLFFSVSFSLQIVPPQRI